MSVAREEHNLTGEPEVCNVWYVNAAGPCRYWEAVTDVPCPCCDDGSVQWAEAGYVPGYRICDFCGRHFMAKGNAEEPCLIEVPNRRGQPHAC